MRETIERTTDQHVSSVIAAPDPRQSTPVAELWDDLVLVCRRIAPLWDLPNYVAVNPFLGLSALPLVEAARTVRDGLEGQILPSAAFYRARWQAGAFGKDDLAAAARRGGHDPLALEDMLSGSRAMPLRAADGDRTFAEQHDQQYGTSWNELICRHVTLCCTVSVPQGVAHWSGPQPGKRLYAAWREMAAVDRSLEIAGLNGWRSWIATLPEQPTDAIKQMLDCLDVSADARKGYFYRLLGGVFGWASLLRRASWETGSADPGALADLLAIRVCCDAAVALLAPRPAARATAPSTTALVEDEAVRFVFQEALEDAYVGQLLSTLAPSAPTTPSTPSMQPVVQAVFCIDVRSEPLRRHLEAQHAAIETRGFAGFFGVSLAWNVDGTSSARCPVLLKPTVQLRSAADAAGAPASGTIKDLLSAPGAAFTFVETAGLAYAARLASDALALFAAAPTSESSARFSLEPDGPGAGIAARERLDLALGILKNMGLRDSFARVVLLCGHESHSANNPHAAGLDCGACGGHGGAINARVAAAVLNDPDVRAGLSDRGWAIPADTWFVAAVHDTSIDRVTLLDSAAVPLSHQDDLDRLAGWLEQAGAAVRAERAAALGLTPKAPHILDRLLRRRARDWSEVRPEWGLARNTTFIAARRQRTRGVHLHGRAFLHEYDWTTDPDNSILTLILSAPMVVASWINLQYFASTVDNRLFGSGNKALHNRIGGLGVVLGNGGDLRTGLAAQSVQSPDGSWFHEPQRLQVLVEAPQQRIEAVLDQHPDVRDLVTNGWVRLFALHDEQCAAARWSAAGWEPV